MEFIDFANIAMGVLFAFITFMYIVSFLALFKRMKFPASEPEISIIIPCYNEEKYVKDCLESVYSSDYPKEKMQVIFVDDGSTDNTLEIVNEFKKKHAPSLRVLHGTHEGKSPALNLGLKETSHDLIIALDSDTVLDKRAIYNIVQPFSRKDIGAANGACMVRNYKSPLGLFQSVEYSWLNVVKQGFSKLTGNGIWFFGFFACYRREALKKIGGFKKDTLTEDMDTALEIYGAGYRTIHVHEAVGYSIVPSNLNALFRQRMRWWGGNLQSLVKHRRVFLKRPSIAVAFLFLNHFMWSIFAFISFPGIGYTFYYWFPAGAPVLEGIIYTLKWFCVIGWIDVFYHIPQWGFSFFSNFGVMVGLVSTLLFILGVALSTRRATLREVLGIFFYFPYTIIINTIVVLGVFTLFFKKKKHFIK